MLQSFIFCHPWGDSAMNLVTREINCQVASQVTWKSLFTVTHYFISDTLFIALTKQTLQKQSLIDQLGIVAKGGFFKRTNVTSRKRDILLLWRHIRQCFLHAKPGTQFVGSERKPWIWIFCHHAFTAQRLRTRFLPLSGNTSSYTRNLQNIGTVMQW